MPTLPKFNPRTKINDSPHVFILGAGASLAAFPDGDKNSRQLPLMPNLVSTLGLEQVFGKHSVGYNGEDFERTYDALMFSGRFPELVDEIESEVSTYFSSLEIPEERTLYDDLLLSLRSKDIIATFNWDPLLAQAYWRNIDAVGYETLPKVAFLHGNVAIGVCYQCQSKGWAANRCVSCGSSFKPSPLLYPVSQKDYSTDEFLKSEWDLLRDHINRAYFITVYGYSAPATDAEAKDLMLGVWETNPTRDLALLEVIDRKEEGELRKTWSEFIVRSNCAFRKHLHETFLGIHPRRTCDALAMANLQQDPWSDNPIPRSFSLSEVQKWVTELISEEKSGELSGQPCEPNKEDEGDQQ